MSLLNIIKILFFHILFHAAGAPAIDLFTGK